MLTHTHTLDEQKDTNKTPPNSYSKNLGFIRFLCSKRTNVRIPWNRRRETRTDRIKFE